MVNKNQTSYNSMGRSARMTLAGMLLVGAAVGGIFSLFSRNNIKDLEHIFQTKQISQEKPKPQISIDGKVIEMKKDSKKGMWYFDGKSEPYFASKEGRMKIEGERTERYLKENFGIDMSNYETEWTTYTVKEGDNLSHIVRDHDMLLKDILNANPSLKENPDLIYEGQILKVIRFKNRKNRDISKKGIKLIKEFEGFEPEPYEDFGQRSIGYGHKIKLGEKYTKITKEKAIELLKKDILWVDDAIDKYVKVPITQNQYDALASFVYNFGDPKFRESTLLKKLNNWDYNGASGEFLRWNKMDREVNEGLVKRRAKEQELFNTR